MNVFQWRNEAISFLEEFSSVARQFFQTDAGQVEGWASELRESRYHVVFIGWRQSGKSTLVNALLEEELLPTGPLPLTFPVSTAVRDGANARVVWKEAGREEIVLFEGQPQGPKHINGILREAVSKVAKEIPPVTIGVRYPLKLDLRGMVLIDTPDTGDLIRARLDVLVPQADATVVVLSASSPFEGKEVDYIREELWEQDVRPLLFVLNKIDRLTNDELQKTVKSVRSTLENTLGEILPIYPVSAYLALRGSQWRDRKVDWNKVIQQDRLMRTYESSDELLKESRLQAFRKDLFKVLNESDWMPTRINSMLEKAEDKLSQFLRQVVSEGSAQAQRAADRLRALVRANRNLLREEVVSLATHSQAVLPYKRGRRYRHEIAGQMYRSLERELAKRQKNLRKLREQAAIYAAGETPLRLLNQIEDEEAEIHRVEDELKALEDDDR